MIYRWLGEGCGEGVGGVQVLFYRTYPPNPKMKNEKSNMALVEISLGDNLTAKNEHSFEKMKIDFAAIDIFLLRAIIPTYFRKRS